jgi:uncharacterized protein (DUF1501 family)
MEFTRREFIRGGVSAFTIGFAAPAFLSDLARAQGASRRCVVVLYLSGGNDALSTVIPYTDPFYRSRRPATAVTQGTEIQIGSDVSGKPLALHPRLTGLKQIYDAGDLAIINRTGYPNSSRSHFTGTDIWNTANPGAPVGSGWLGRYLDLLPSPIDPLAGWVTQRDIPRALIGNEVSVPAIPNPAQYAFASPNPNVTGEPQFARAAMTSIASHLPPDQPHLAFVNGTTQAALATLDKVNSVATYAPSVAYGADGLSQAFRAVAGAIVRGLGTKVFWVQTGGYDTHATQNVNAANGYGALMITLNTAVTTFYNDMRNQGLLNDVMIVQFSEFGRRISENSAGTNAAGTDHGAAGIMMAIGGGVNGGIIGTAPNLNPFAGNPTLENNGNDVTFESDFRSVYAKLLEGWMGVNSVPILNGNFTSPSMPLTFI